MKKKFISIAKKAMVWTMAASMLVATPLATSAKGLNSVFQIENNRGEIIGNDGNPNTGTVTGTKTDTSTRPLRENLTAIEGINVDPPTVELKVSDDNKSPEETVTATIVMNDGTAPDAGWNKLFSWKSSNSSVVALENPQKGEGFTNKMILRAKSVPADSEPVTVTVYIPGTDLTKTIDVTVKKAEEEGDNPTTYINWSDDIPPAYVGHTLDLSDYVEADGDDEITFEITKLTVEKAATLNKDGVLSLNKVGEVTVIAKTDTVVSDPLPITIEAGNVAKNVKVYMVKSDKSRPKLSSKATTWNVNKESTKMIFEAEVTAKNSANPCTDKITWESKNTSIVDIVEGGDNDGEKVAFEAHKTGTVSIQAKATNLKATTVKVKVTATMTGFDISVDEDDSMLYSGQTLNLDERCATRYFGVGENKEVDEEKVPNNFVKTALTWSLTGSGDKNYATIKKGVLTIKNVDIPAERTLTITAKKGRIMPAEDQSIEINIGKLNVTAIEIREVKDGESVSDDLVATNANAGNATIMAGHDRTYQVIAHRELAEDEDSDIVNETLLPDNKTPVASVLAWKSGNAKVVTAKWNSEGYGEVGAIKKNTKAVNVTVSGATASTNSRGRTSYGTIKATIKVKATQPTESITLTSKNAAIPYNAKKEQKITITPKLDKGTSSKTSSINWTASKGSFVDGEFVGEKLEDSKINKGKLTVDKATGAGIWFEIKANMELVAKDDGVDENTTIEAEPIYLQVVTPSYAVQIQNPADNNKKITTLNKKVGDDAFTIQSRISLRKTGKFETVPGYIDYDESGNIRVQYADVEYTTNRPDVVKITEGDDGMATVKCIAPGTAKITVKTRDGKTAKINVKVKMPSNN